MELHSPNCLEQLSPARARLITQYSVVAQHPNEDRAFRQSLYLVARPRLLGGAVFDHGRARCAGLRSAHRQPVSQSVTIRRAAGGGVEHLAVDGIVSLSEV